MMVELYSLRIKSTQRDIQVSQTIFDIKGENMQIFAKKERKTKREHTQEQFNLQPSVYIFQFYAYTYNNLLH